jgi:hypothetical protein
MIANVTAKKMTQLRARVGRSNSADTAAVELAFCARPVSTYFFPPPPVENRAVVGAGRDAGQLIKSQTDLIKL